MPMLSVNDQRIAYEVRGCGEPCVLLHAGGSNGRQWNALVSLIAEDHTCYLPDLCGHGASPPWNGKDAPSLADFAAIVDAIERIAGPVRHVVGHSHGGAVAITYAVQASERLSSLTLIEPTLMHLLRTAGSAAAWTEARELGSKHIDAVARGKADDIADEFLPYWIGDEAWQAMPDERRAAIIATMPAVAHFWSSAFAETTPAGIYARMNVPTLLIRGAETRATTREIVDLLCGLLPHCRMLEIGGAGHMSPLTHASEVNIAIKEHLAQHSKTDSG
jgi:pimeloyl-ACP methyl ester carboxylesterase